MVMGVPDSGIPAAEGYARRSGIPYGQGLVKNRYIGRTFIAPDQRQRDQGVRRKLNPLRDNIEGKRLVVVDDSIVRGTTTRAMVRMLRDCGAAEIHLRISSPPYRWPCFYGLDTGTRAELIAANLEVGEIRDYVGADSLVYLDLDALKTAIGVPGAGFCSACLTGDYPVEVPVTLVQGRPRTHRWLIPGKRAAARGLTYAAAGVDIDAGDRAVGAIKDLVRSTYRPEVLGDIGGFGGLFRLPGGYRQPVLVASTDGVGTKIEVARAIGPVHDHRHRSGRHVRRRPGVPGGRAAVLPRLPGAGADRRLSLVVQLMEGIAEGLPAGRLRHPGRRAGRASRVRWRPTSSTWSGSRSASPSGTGSSAPNACRRATSSSAWSRPDCAATATPWPGGPCSTWPAGRSTGPPQGSDRTLGDELLAARR